MTFTVILLRIVQQCILAKNTFVVWTKLFHFVSEIILQFVDEP